MHAKIAKKKLKYVKKFLSHIEVVFLKIESFFDPKSIEIYHILCIFSVDYNVVEVK